MGKYTLFVVVVLVGLAATLAWSNWQRSPEAAAQVRLAVSRTPLSTPLLVAAERGYFEAEGLDARVSECLDGHRCLEAVLAGKVDFGTVSDSPLMFASFERDDFAVLATFVTSNEDVKLITRSDTGIVALEGLVGKRVGVVKGTSSEYFLHVNLLLGGVDAAGIEVVHLQPESMVEALVAGDIDALSIWEPYGFQAMKTLGANGKILPHPAVYTESFNLVASKGFLVNRPELSTRVLQALQRAVEFIRQDREGAQQVVMDKLDQDREFIEWIWPHFNFDLTLGQGLINTMESEARWAIETKQRPASAMPNFLKIVHETPLREVSPLAVTIIR